MFSSTKLNALIFANRKILWKQKDLAIRIEVRTETHPEDPTQDVVVRIVFVADLGAEEAEQNHSHLTSY
jgi:hypothetical protein